MSRPQQQQQQPPQGQSQQSPPANKPPRPLPYSPHPHRPQARISSTNEPSKAQQAPPAAAAPPAKEQRPPPHQWKPVEPLPAAYKPAARRWTLAIVAMPVALVTSYALYDRLVLGNKRKEFPRVVNPDLSSAVKEVEAEKTEKGL
ncbi:hypothetical protein SLS58_005102 [Diplodia intermedia]|uniref:Uncharacterized protein n=1 Tax=Diplodia intermedia TaxID=856260 RepID=A0ABR3TRT4_9PEZI